MGCPNDLSIYIDPNYDPDDLNYSIINLERLSSIKIDPEDIEISLIPWE